MLTTPPPHNFDHKRGIEIPTKHKEAIRWLYRFRKVLIPVLMLRYKLGDTIIQKSYNMRNQNGSASAGLAGLSFSLKND